MSDLRRYPILLQRLCYSLFILLIVEGLLRKLVPGLVSTLIFFGKDIILAYALVQLLRIKQVSLESNKYNRVVRILLALFIPLLVIHAFYDPVLVPWGLKQYVFYAITGSLLISAFIDGDFERFVRFFKTLSFFIIPTVIIALIQLQLPATHWLNRAVDGGNLSGFAAAGFLRVSSSFSFTGQFSFFLHFISAVVFSLLYFPELRASSGVKRSTFTKFLPVLYLGCLILGVFVTGGRTAVFGAGSVFALGLIFSLFKNQSFVLKKSVVPILGLLALLLLLPVFKPDAFAAYTQRSSGYNGQSNTEEIQGRVLGSFTGGFKNILQEDNPIAFVFGKGLGVMTNGVDQISRYAARIRANIWTETDFATTAWEGGLYLIVVWYGFRIYMFLYCWQRWRRIRDRGLSMCAAFFLGYILVTGLVGTLSIQPPVSIYWWGAIGIVILLQHYDARFQLDSSNT
ncbi:hypothetical protein [Leeuwenhoekiella nanhaiensis]|uniref:O-antigen ligase domain-containing protein n=1 Tax=Leeuwenhoekiella nanhaiensis TaxID=1655491 RepID=A0A2G1VP74_9FLAO|nr:hypothetical protein [Leeuwenhoekiella nanhaiensis]PHQ28279.1 hypothetical protein CJ305_15700 [Leeuwenhoekiella nanhaiensis]